MEQVPFRYSKTLQDPVPIQTPYMQDTPLLETRCKPPPRCLPSWLCNTTPFSSCAREQASPCLCEGRLQRRIPGQLFSAARNMRQGLSRAGRVENLQPVGAVLPRPASPTFLALSGHLGCIPIMAREPVCAHLIQHWSVERDVPQNPPSCVVF